MSDATTEKPKELDAFTLGYLAALEFADMPEDAPDGCELSPLARMRSIYVCAVFLKEHAADVEAYGEEQAGHDLWLTRRGHGAGYWEEDHGPDDATERAALCKRLDDAAKALGDVDVYVGDDALLHLDGDRMPTERDAVVIRCFKSAENHTLYGPVCAMIELPTDAPELVRIFTSDGLADELADYGALLTGTRPATSTEVETMLEKLRTAGFQPQVRRKWSAEEQVAAWTP